MIELRRTIAHISKLEWKTIFVVIAKSVQDLDSNNIIIFYESDIIHNIVRLSPFQEILFLQCPIPAAILK